MWCLLLNKTTTEIVIFPVLVEAIIPAFLFWDCLLIWVVFCFTTFAILTWVENRGTIICISAQKK